MKRILLVGLTLMMAATAGLAATPAPKTSDEYSGYTYKERSGEFTVLVYSWLAHWRVNENFFPLVIAVGRSPEPHFKGETPTEKKEARAEEKKPVLVTLNNFQFADAQGNICTPASFEQITQQYKYLPADKNLLVDEPMVTAQLFETSAQLEAPFYPVSGGLRLGITEVELQESSYFQTTIYFPRPAAGLDGVLTFTLKGAPFDPPISVRFMLPQEHQKKVKDKEKKG